jgi:hypothetical protein
MLLDSMHNVYKKFGLYLEFLSFEIKLPELGSDEAAWVRFMGLNLFEAVLRDKIVTCMDVFY